MSQAGGKADRTEFKRLLLEAYQKKFDLVVFWHLDRLAMREPWLHFLKKLKDHGVNYKSCTVLYLDPLGRFGDVIVSMLTTIATQDLIKTKPKGSPIITSAKSWSSRLAP